MSGRPAAERRLAGRRLADAGLEDLAHQDLVDRRSVGQPGSLDRGPDRDAAERRSPASRTSAPPNLPIGVRAALTMKTWPLRPASSLDHQRVRGNPRSIFDVPGSGQRWVTILARV